ncbi:hypothetical protein P8H27_17870 [Pseudomonas sp. sp1636]|uniref:hypothetical protein n=1 Tax=Pseudomonas sp. sp1636 TaxID=3036707 RepID=UPI0025A61335|nr:hypothetical protein [Pseudomonas sp. sp1636]MDM8350747.1 hypothetical protein [Pseudomonas sp. sp1636]
MRLTSVLPLALAALCSLASYARDYPGLIPQERPAGSPGTATPQPFSQPLPRNLPSPAPNNPPLLNDGTGYKANPSGGSLAPPDGELPLLEQQRQRNSQGLPGSRKGRE